MKDFKITDDKINKIKKKALARLRGEVKYEPYSKKLLRKVLRKMENEENDV